VPSGNTLGTGGVEGGGLEESAKGMKGKKAGKRLSRVLPAEQTKRPTKDWGGGGANFRGLKKTTEKGGGHQKTSPPGLP